MDDSLFLYRAAVGVLLLFALAVAEWRDHRRTTRMREYLFLLAVASGSILYALIHDAFTFGIAPEYFFVLKAVHGVGFYPGVAWLAAQAGWTAGLVVGLGFLIANNPGRRRQLSYGELGRCVPLPLVWSVAAAVGGGAYAHFVMPANLGDFGLMEPRRVVTVWGIHIGSYVGAAAGLLHACIRIRRLRASKPMSLAATKSLATRTAE